MNGILVYWFVWRPFHARSILAPILPGLFKVSLGGSVNQTPLSRHFGAKDISNNFLPLITIHTKICKLPLNIILKVLFTGQENGTRKMGCQSVLNCFVSVTTDT